MINRIICFQTDTFTFLDRVYHWSANKAHYTSWKNLDRKPEQGMYYVSRGKLGLDSIEIPVEIYDGNKFQGGVIKIDVSPDEEDIRVIITWEEIFTPIVAFLIIDISKEFKQKKQPQAGVTGIPSSNPERNSRKDSGDFNYDYEGRRKIVELFREEKTEGKSQI